MSDGESSLTICKICEDKPSKYCCPRCNILYCSLSCYKSDRHLECSENFYKECVTEQLSSQAIDESSKQKMLDILNRINEAEDEEGGDTDASFDSDDEAETIDLADRLKDVNLEDSESVWHALNEDERKEFEALLQSGDVMNMLPPWKPWWIHKKNSKLVQEMNDDSAKNESESLLPVLLNNVPDFMTISKQQPASCVKHNLVNVLSSYVYTARLFNGDHLSCALEATSCLLSVCSNLRNGANYENAISAVESVVQECQNNPATITDKTNIDTMRYDVVCLLQSQDKSNARTYINYALSDMHKLISEAKTNLKSSKSDNSHSQTFARRFPNRKVEEIALTPIKLRSSLRKLEYYLSFMKSYSNQVNQELFGLAM